MKISAIIKIQQRRSQEQDTFIHYPSTSYFLMTKMKYISAIVSLTLTGTVKNTLSISVKKIKKVNFIHKFLIILEGRVDMKDKIRKTELCKSLAGNSLDLVIITNFHSSEQDISNRDAVIITGRIHPGETNASFIVEGILDFL